MYGWQDTGQKGIKTNRVSEHVSTKARLCSSRRVLTFSIAKNWDSAAHTIRLCLYRTINNRKITRKAFESRWEKISCNTLRIRKCCFNDEKVAVQKQKFRSRFHYRAFFQKNSLKNSSASYLMFNVSFGIRMGIFIFRTKPWFHPFKKK